MHKYCDMSRFADPYKDHDYGNDGYPGEMVYGDDVYIDDYYMDELWKPIDGFKDSYWVSDMARVWSVQNQQFLKVKPLDNHGHLGVCLYKDGERYYKYIHRLVAKAFIPNPHNYPIVRHIEDIPCYNTVDDIDYGTRLDNHRDCMRNGHWHKPTREELERGIEKTRTPIVAINLRTGKKTLFRSQGEAGRILGIPQANIWKVLNGERPRAQGYSFKYISREDEKYEYY